MKRRSKLVCCKGCGRDTILPGGYCSACYGGYHSKSDQWRKRKDVANTALEVEQPNRTRAEEYNGDSERDDI